MPKILLVTTVTWSCAERLAGALAQANVEALFPAGHAVAVSRHLKRAHPYRALSPLASIRKAIARAKPDLVIPCEDRAALLLARLYEQGEARDLLGYSLGAPELVPRLYDRRYFIAEAAKAGVEAAGMLPAPNEAALERGIDWLGLPLVIKSDGSFGGEGVIIAHTRAEARDAWHCLGRTPNRWRELARAIRRRDPHFLSSALHPQTPTVGLQRFIPGRPATSTLLCWKGEVLGANHFDVEETQRHTGPATVLARRECPQMDDAARRIARHFGLSGLIGLDFIRDHNGQVHLLEINPRANPTSHLALGPRHDPCGALLELLGVAAAPRPAVTEASHIALFPQEYCRDRNSPWVAKAFMDVPPDDPAVVHALMEASRPGLNDDLATEFAEFLGPQAPKADWDAPALTNRQAASP